MGKYKDEILRLRSEDKTYKEICEILGCSMSIIAYHTISSERNRQLKSDSRKRKNGEAYKTRAKCKNRNRQIVIEHLQNHPCVDCGITDIRVLEFDHVRGKKLGNISWAVQQTWSKERLLDEISKCEVRCCNCHRIVTIERRKSLNKPII